MAEAARHLDRESYEESIPQLTGLDIKPTLENFDQFVKRYEPCFYRKEQREHFCTELRGLLSDLPRKTIEPISFDHQQPDYLLQHFVGAGRWDDEKLLAEFHEQVVEEFGDPDGVLVLDGSGFPKKGTESVGVKRQYCGRTGKIDNCQVGAFLAYASRHGGTLVARRLYLPREWARSPKRRRKAHVPDDVRYRSTIQISNELLQQYGSRFPHGWITGDDEFGRITWFRYALADRGERYLLEVPTNTHIRHLDAVPPERSSGLGPPTKPPFLPVLAWAHAQPRSSWNRIQIRDGEKGPLEVEAITARVQCRFQRRVGREETLLVTRTLGNNPEYKGWLGNARLEASIEQLAWVASMRHRIEEFIEWGKQDAGLAEYEVRSWIGWHHHMTLSLLALGFLAFEHKRMEKKEADSHGLDGRPSARQATA